MLTKPPGFACTLTCCCGFVPIAHVLPATARCSSAYAHQDFKSDLAQKPTAVQQLLKQYGSGPPDTPGPLQQLMVVVAPHMQHLIDSWQAPGCEPLQALHKLIEQLQQVGIPCKPLTVI